jgi:hypothetical protein
MKKGKTAARLETTRPEKVSGTFSGQGGTLMATEKQWVQSLQRQLNEDLQDCNDEQWKVRVDTGKKLTYAYEITRYNNDDRHDQPHRAKYETDLLVYDINSNKDWIPRVVVECKTGSVTTHDALTYSTKASTHKHVHPYLRYGVLVGDFGTSLPGRLIRHGAHFDFMMVWSTQEGTSQERSELIGLLKEELQASRNLQNILHKTPSKTPKKLRFLHRPLKLKEADG